jgi:ribulose-bisphosphate carboxylase small chain
MRITQGTFSFLPDLSDAQIAAQVDYCLRNGWAVNIEHTDDPHPRNTYWELWKLPFFDATNDREILRELAECRAAYPRNYVRVSGYDRAPSRQTTALQFIVQRPPREPGFRLDRIEGADRTIRYSLYSYATDRPEGERYED